MRGQVTVTVPIAGFATTVVPDGPAGRFAGSVSRPVGTDIWRSRFSTRSSRLPDVRVHVNTREPFFFQFEIIIGSYRRVIVIRADNFRTRAKRPDRLSMIHAHNGYGARFVSMAFSAR